MNQNTVMSGSSSFDLKEKQSAQPNWVLQIHWQRDGFTPEQGQAKLAEIAEEVKRLGQQTLAGNFGRVEVAGTLMKDPFPAWMKPMLVNAIPGLIFDDINFFFYRNYGTLDDAKHYGDWVMNDFKSWAKKAPEYVESAERLQVRIMDAAGNDMFDDVIEAF